MNLLALHKSTDEVVCTDFCARLLSRLCSPGPSQVPRPKQRLQSDKGSIISLKNNQLKKRDAACISGVGSGGRGIRGLCETLNLLGSCDVIGNMAIPYTRLHFLYLFHYNQPFSS